MFVLKGKRYATFVAKISSQFRLKPGILVHCIVLCDLHVQYVEIELTDG